jgi:hypothetical protein
MNSRIEKYFKDGKYISQEELEEKYKSHGFHASL